MNARSTLLLSMLALLTSFTGVACNRNPPAPAATAAPGSPTPAPIPAIPAIPAIPVAPAPAAQAAPAAPAAPAAAATPTPAAAPSAPTPTGGNGQLEVNSSNPNFGTVTLASGFMPDPNTTNVTSGGNIDVSTLSGLPDGCAGWVTGRPDFVLNLSSTSSMLRFFVVAAEQGGDTTLVINDGAGNWHCNDDVQPGNFNPMVDIANAPTGHYDIWVGSYSQTAQVRGVLNITEMSSRRP